MALNQAEVLMQEKPDSSLNILEQIDPDNLSRRKDKAKYALLYSQALDKNYFDKTNDSLILVAINYYQEHGTEREKMLAYYYLGRVQYNAHAYQNAIISFLQAEEYALHAGDYLYCGLIYRNISDIYNDTYNTAEELKYAQKAYDCFCQADASLHKDYALLALGIAYGNASDRTKEKELLEQTIVLARERCDTLLWGICLSSYALCQEVTEDYRGAKESILSIKNRLRLPIDLRDWVTLAHCYARENKTDSVDFCLNEAGHSAATSADSAKISLRIYWIEKIRNNPQKALNALEYCNDFQITVSRQMLQQSVITTQRDHFRSRADAATYKLKANHRLGIIVILSICLFAGAVIFWLYRRIQRKNTEIERYMNIASDIQDVLQSKNTEMSHLVTQLFHEKFELIDSLGCTYYERRDTPNEQIAIYNEVKRAIQNLGTDKQTKSELERIVNLCNEDILKKIRAQIPEIKMADYDLFCYLCAGFSYRAISIFMQTKIDNVYNRKSRLKMLIGNSAAASKEIFLQNIR
ncbi:hypothetical protein [uncultured Alistipes sp.]|uniref:hypothetical protein n=1 Tax=uncultured Alistipes sp. TaxID=538949 RepID=UPI0027310760|nr:hypothetical protein [uncultured Alistipes sp.]